MNLSTYIPNKTKHKKWTLNITNGQWIWKHSGYDNFSVTMTPDISNRSVAYDTFVVFQHDIHDIDKQVSGAIISTNGKTDDEIVKQLLLSLKHSLDALDKSYKNYIKQKRFRK